MNLQTEEEFFNRALALPATERTTFLAREWRGDEKLRVAMESLLQLHGEAGSFMKADLTHSLSVIGVSGAVDGPQLRVFSGSTQIAQNDNWDAAAIGNAFALVWAFNLPAGNKDAALLASLPAGQSSTVNVSGVGSSSGVVLIEVYDADGIITTNKLTNAAVRGGAGFGADALILWFSMSGIGQRTMLIRAAGPALAALNVPGTLADPQLSVFDTFGRTLATNSAWGSEDAAATLSLAGPLLGRFPFPPAVATPPRSSSLSRQTTRRRSRAQAVAWARRWRKFTRCCKPSPLHPSHRRNHRIHP